ncbi:MAG: DUF2141 domain-containing protein, partial [Bacteroidota bacterium]
MSSRPLESDLLTSFDTRGLHRAVQLLALVLVAGGLLAPALFAQPATQPDTANPATSTVVVEVTGIPSAEGVVGCALFNDPDPFPMKREGAVQSQEHPADPAGVTCRFEGVPAGAYAFSTSHDKNVNGKTDTNFLGMPKEAWGVSNNVRPRL